MDGCEPIYAGRSHLISGGSVSIKPFFNLMRNGHLAAFAGSSGLLKPFYRLVYLVAAQETGLFELLRDGPVGFEQLVAAYCRDGGARGALEAWLQLGVRLGLLKLGPVGFELKGLAKKLAQPQNDSIVALLQEAAGLHYKLILDTPGKLRKGELWTLADQDGEIIARSSRVMEAFQTEAIDSTFPAAGPVRLLEIGCGSGFYIKFAAAKNPSLSALGLELQENVAVVARRNIEGWGLQDRVRIETGDIRSKAPDERFDIATLYNNIYYFPVEERVSLLRHIREFIQPGGFLLLTTCCQGGSLVVEVLNLWGAATANCGRLPTANELVSQLQQAGFEDVQTIRLIPGEAFFSFKAHHGRAA
jgi:SAM-dependent methyltransferase